jgi:hypothetical protein
MPRGGPQPNAGRKPAPNGQTICWTLQIELVKAEAKRHGKTPGVFAGQILAEVLQVNVKFDQGLLTTATVCSK